MNKSKLIVAIVLSLAAIAAIVAVIIPKDVEAQPVTAEEMAWATGYLRDSLNEPSVLYTDFIERHSDVVTPEFSLTVPSPVSEIQGEELINYSVTVPAAGLYSLTLECAAKERSFVNMTLGIGINGEVQYSEAENIDVPMRWADQTKDFVLDSFGDESVPSTEFVSGMRPLGLYNNTYLSTSPILFLLESGENTVTIGNMSTRVLSVGSLTVESHQALPSYETYRAANPGEPVTGANITVDGTDYTEKNSTFVQLVSTTDIGARPSDPVNKKVNFADFNEVGAEAEYTVNIEQSGLYAFALHMATPDDDFASFCTLKIDGEIPFAEAAAFPLSYGGEANWDNKILSNPETNEPYYIYLEAGSHTVSLRGESEPVAAQLRSLRLIIDHINQFSLDVKKIAGKDVDKNRTWRLTRYMPETEDTLRAYNIMLRGLSNELARFSEKGVNAAALSGLMESIGFMENLMEEPDELPLYLENLSGDRVSVLMSCGKALDNLMSRWFSVDEFYLYDGAAELERANPPFYSSLGAMGSQLVASFVSPKYAVQEDDEAINIWINASVMLADTLQKMADSQFTPATGTKVKFSIMPDQNKLVLASAADTQPDIAMAIEHHIPFELSLRGAVYDLTQFDDFWEVADRFTPGSMVAYVFNDGVYALAESIDFQALVYRKDVLNSLNLEPPDTWYDVQDMMSELQRFDMSFYMPIASGVGYKWYHQTSPLIYQFGGSFYTEDGMAPAINQPNAVKGIAMMGEMFTTYALNEQVPSFFNSFRFGQTPVGITGNADYMLIKYGAPELTGQWALTLPPGIPQEDGGVSRWYIANGRAASIMAESDKIEECWEFLKWWTSEEVQTEYAFSLLSQYGYVFLPGNMNALQNSYLPDEDKEVILESVNWLRDVPRSPGQYMLERTLSDIWNSIVFDGTPPQVEIDLKDISIRREFSRKMTEFGYADENGNPIKEYHVRELDWIQGKLEEER